MSKSNFTGDIKDNVKGVHFIEAPLMEYTLTLEAKNDEFHDENRQMKYSEIEQKLKDQKMRELYYLNGGVMGAIPKPEPQGSFNRPLNTSGNSTFGSRLTGSGFRTLPGQVFGKQLLKQRAEQLRKLEEVRTGVIEPSTEEKAKAEPKPSRSTDPDEIELDQLLSEASVFAEGDRVEDLEAKDMRKIFNLVRKLNFQLSREKLRSIINEINDILEKLIVFTQDYITTNQRFIEKVQDKADSESIRPDSPDLYNKLIKLVQSEALGKFTDEVNVASILTETETLAKKLLENKDLQPENQELALKGILDGIKRQSRKPVEFLNELVKGSFPNLPLLQDTFKLAKRRGRPRGAKSKKAEEPEVIEVEPQAEQEAEEPQGAVPDQGGEEEGKEEEVEGQGKKKSKPRQSKYEMLFRKLRRKKEAEIEVPEDVAETAVTAFENKHQDNAGFFDDFMDFE